MWEQRRKISRNSEEIRESKQEGTKNETKDKKESNNEKYRKMNGRKIKERLNEEKEDKN